MCAKPCICRIINRPEPPHNHEADVCKAPEQYQPGAVFIHISTMAEYDLTHSMSKFMDRHMLIPLLEFLQSKEVSTGRLLFMLITCLISSCTKKKRF